MTYHGRVQNGVIVLDDSVNLPEGAEVEVSTQKAGSNQTWNERLKDVIGIAQGLPEDMAENHDHYIHGAPKR
jgi:predicted DNA-binding antitoxin AbrB/MazE fold protein